MNNEEMIWQSLAESGGLARIATIENRCTLSPQTR
jgi:hypothetical protein